jgi:hypothetical protein
VFQLTFNLLLIRMNEQEQDQRTNNIINRLEALSLETNELLRELRETQPHERRIGATTTPAHTRTPPHEFVVGDRVVIANNYRRQRNTQGTVIYVTAQRVTLIDAQGNRHTRKPTNLRKLQHGQ